MRELHTIQDIFTVSSKWLSYIFVAFLIITPKILISQSWARTYGTSGQESVSSLTATSDGCYLVAGNTNYYASYQFDILLVKVDILGNIVWEKIIGNDNSSEYVNSVYEAFDGGVIVSGYTILPGVNNNLSFLVIKVDIDGNFVWGYAFEHSFSSWSNSVIQTNDGSIVISGERRCSCPYFHPWIIKLDGNGNFMWDMTYYAGHGYEWNGINAIQETSDGGFILAGYMGLFPAVSMLLIKVDEKGEIMWQKRYGNNAFDHALSILTTNDGGYFVSGFTRQYNYYLWVLKLDSFGDIQWQESYPAGDLSQAVIQTADGGYILAGSAPYYGSDNEVWVIKISNIGAAEWKKSYLTPDNANIASILPVQNGGYIMAGTNSYYGAGNNDFWVLKMDETGEIDSSCWFINNAWVSEFTIQGSIINVSLFEHHIWPSRTAINLNSIDANLLVEEQCSDAPWCVDDLGDVNLNSDISTMDASLILQAVVGRITLTSSEECRADTNLNDIITSMDAALVLSCTVGNCTSIPAGYFHLSCEQHSNCI